ncbi:MAG: ROK family transcriptional regulator [Limnochordaceae bacterium]|nr:ROK family transcriptional regulator [Limnochordaceae bacterium]
MTSQQRQVLLWLSRRGPLTRSQLGRLTGGSATAVWQAVQALAAQGWIRPDGTQASGGGRPAARWVLAPTGQRIGVVRVRPGWAGLRWFDLDGTEVETAAGDGEKLQVSWPADESADAVLPALRQLLTEALSRHGRRPTGWAVCVPGVIDPAGMVLYSSPLGLRDAALGEYLRTWTGLPAVVGNDVDMAALGESSWGAGQGCRRLLYLWIDQGIGLGFVQDGQLYMGSRGSAGELGHFTVSPEGPPCRCGNRGCLGMIASEPALVGQASRLVWVDQQSVLRQLAGGDLNRVDLATLGRALAAGDPLVTQVVEEAWARLGIVTANVVNLLDPDVVLVEGSVYRLDPDRMLATLRRAVQTHGLPTYRETIRIDGGRLGEEACWRGAVAWFRERWWGAAGQGGRSAVLERLAH